MGIPLLPVKMVEERLSLAFAPIGVLIGREYADETVVGRHQTHLPAQAVSPPHGSNPNDPNCRDHASCCRLIPAQRQRGRLGARSLRQVG
jgi:hypothetical protein